MIPDRGFWMDEAFMTPSALQPTFGQWWHHLTTDPMAEALKPLYLLGSWITAQVTGTSEHAFRSVNIFWTYLAAIFVRRSIPGVAGLYAAAIFVLHPYVWHQAGEARPYSLQLACGAALVWVLVKISNEKTISLATASVWAFASVFVFGSSLLGGFAVASFLIIVLPLLIKNRIVLARYAWVPVLVAMAAGLTLTLHYLTALTKGYGGAILWNVGLINIFAVGYEFAGMGGLGPPREDIRGIIRGGFGGLMEWSGSFVVLAAFLTITSVTAITAAMSRRSHRGFDISWRVVLAFSVLACVLTAVAAFVWGWPFWGRHLAFAFPGFFVATGLWLTTRKLSKLLVALLIMVTGFWILSAGRLRWMAEYAPEDNRTAAIIAKRVLETGGAVWWVASPEAAFYYLAANRGPLGSVANRNLLHIIRTDEQWSSARLAKAPTAIIIGRPDTWDSSRAGEEAASYYGLIKTSDLPGKMTVWKKNTATD
jgi:hypothetical protein